MKESKTDFNPKELNVLQNDIYKTYRSNSQFHYKNISSFNYEHRIRLNPLGESKTIDIRHNFPLNHVKDSTLKKDHLNDFNNKNKHSAYNKADIQSKITSLVKNQKYQVLLENDKHIEKLCNIKNNEIKSEIDNRKLKLKKQLTRIIKDALIFSKKNNPIKSMLPENINEIVDEAKKKAQDMSFSLNMSNLSRISTMKGDSKPQKNSFLSLLGVDMENLTVSHVNVDIDKAWDYIVKLSKGRKIEDILRYKVVNALMSLTEKKASEKVKKIYEKLAIYNKYMEKKKKEEIKKKQKEEKEKYQEMRRNNPKEIIKLKMLKSLSEPKLFSQIEHDKKKTSKTNRNKKVQKKNTLKKSQSAIFPTNKKEIIKFNAYKDINELIEFIDNSKKGSQSKLCKDHYMAIKMRKSMDINIKNMINKNQIQFK